MGQAALIGMTTHAGTVTELDLPRDALLGALLQVGKRRFARLTA